MEIRKISINDDMYPDMLRLIKDAPEQLWYSGDIGLLQGNSIAIVGSRNCTEYGMKQAHRIAEKLGEAGIHVVSGMAFGIDTAAHQGALGTKGSTVAVLGCGIDMETSPGKRGLFTDILDRGLVISEYPPGYPASRYTFPRRNRIISGLSSATLVVEAGFNSGSLITAELALEQGRCVYALPGNIDSEVSFGSNKLIKDGAVPVVTVYDILDDMGIYINEDIDIGHDEAKVLRLLDEYGELTLKRMSSMTEMDKKKLSSIVTVLEMKGIVCSSMGRIFRKRKSEG